MTRGLVLDPTSHVDEVSNPQGQPFGDLAGKRIGLRRDIYWKSWDWVTDEWANALRERGAEVVFWRFSPPVGKQTEELTRQREEFLGQVDAAVFGLGNCGSCTMWTVRDGLRSLDRGTPTVLVATEHFEGLSRTIAGQGGRPVVRLLPLPFPLEGRAEDEVRAIAREHFAGLLEVAEVSA